MKKPISLWIALLIVVVAHAQGDPDNLPRPILLIKGEMANLINPVDPSLLGSIEFFPLKQLSFSQEFGYVTNIRSYKNVDLVRSFKMRQEVRYYLPFDLKRTRFFARIDYQYRLLVVNERYVLGYECNGDCEYYRNFSGDFKTDRHAWQVGWGISSRLTERFFLEGDFGLGRYRYTLDRSAIGEGQLIENDRFLEEEVFGNHPYITFRAKLGYMIIGGRKEAIH